eukprot:1806015-Amphidinium_carterae.1
MAVSADAWGGTNGFTPHVLTPFSKCASRAQKLAIILVAMVWANASLAATWKSFSLQAEGNQLRKRVVVSPSRVFGAPKTGSEKVFGATKTVSAGDFSGVPGMHSGLGVTRQI